MKSVDTTRCRNRSKSVSPCSSPRSSRRIVPGSTSSAWMPNLLASSRCHCSASAGPQSTARPVASPCSSSSVAISAGLDGLADADVVGDQQPDRVLPQRHQQRDELVGAGFDGEPGQRPERPGAGPEADPQRRPQQPGARRGADVRGSGGGEGGRADLLQRREDAGDLVVAAGQRAQDQEIGRLRLREHHPLPAAGLDERARPRMPEAPFVVTVHVTGLLTGRAEHARIAGRDLTAQSVPSRADRDDAPAQIAEDILAARSSRPSGSRSSSGVLDEDGRVPVRQAVEGLAACRGRRGPRRRAAAGRGRGSQATNSAALPVRRGSAGMRLDPPVACRADPPRREASLSIRSRTRCRLIMSCTRWLP